MADDNSNPHGEFLTGLRDSVAGGESVYGPVGSPSQVAKLAELDAKIALGRQLGEIAPAPEPWSVNRAAQERLAAEFPAGDVSQEIAQEPEAKVAYLTAQFDRIAGLDTREQADIAQRVAGDFANRASVTSMRHSGYQRAMGSYPSGTAIVDALIAEAEPAINAATWIGDRQKTLQLLRLDRQMLELWAARGRNVAAYAARKAQLGLK